MASQVYDADVIVVGAGTGGLTCAAYLAAAGKKVIAFDRHWVAGGNLTSFTHHGFEFDVGLHYIGDCQPGGLVPSLLEPLGIEQRFDVVFDAPVQGRLVQVDADCLVLFVEQDVVAGQHRRSEEVLAHDAQVATGVVLEGP